MLTTHYGFPGCPGHKIEEMYCAGRCLECGAGFCVCYTEHCCCPETDQYDVVADDEEYEQVEAPASSVDVVVNVVAAAVGMSTEKRKASRPADVADADSDHDSDCLQEKHRRSQERVRKIARRRRGH